MRDRDVTLDRKRALTRLVTRYIGLLPVKPVRQIDLAQLSRTARQPALRQCVRADQAGQVGTPLPSVACSLCGQRIRSDQYCCLNRQGQTISNQAKASTHHGRKSSSGGRLPQFRMTRLPIVRLLVVARADGRSADAIGEALGGTSPLRLAFHLSQLEQAGLDREPARGLVNYLQCHLPGAVGASGISHA